MANPRPVPRPFDHVIPIRDGVVVFPLVFLCGVFQNDGIGAERAGGIQSLKLSVTEAAHDIPVEFLSEGPVYIEDLIGLRIRDINNLVDAVEDGEEL